MGHLNRSAGPRGFLMEDAPARMGLGNLRCVCVGGGGAVFDRKARPKWPFTGFSLLGSSEAGCVRVCVGVPVGRCWRRVSEMNKSL